MRPARTTPAHQTEDFAELVCSNSLKSESENTAPWLLKEEMRRAGSLLLEIARDTAVPAGHALAVDRAEFSRKVTEAISHEPLITIRREEVTQVCSRPTDSYRNRSADVGRALAGNCAAEFVSRFDGRCRCRLFAGQSPATTQPVFLRFHQPHRRGRFHRHEQGVPGRPLRQRVGRLHQLSNVESGVRPFLRCAARGAIGGTERLGKPELLRKLPAHRRDRPPRTRHAAFRSDEAGRA